MAEEKATQVKEVETKVETAKPEAVTSKPESKRLIRNTSKVRPNKKQGKGGDNRSHEEDEFEHKIIDTKRVTRMYKGGRRMRISVFVVVGDKKGRVGLGIGKSIDVKNAMEKAISKAKKNLVYIQLKGNTIPHDVFQKHGAAKVYLKPASPGTGIIAGSSMRMVAEVAGIKDVLGKIMGTNNAIANAYATVEALSSIRSSRL